MNRKQPHRGKVPYGYQRCSQNEIVPHTDESKILQLLFELFIQHRRKGTVARLLNEQDFRTRTNSNWSDMAVARILADSNYNQILKGSSSEDDKALVISQNQWDQAQDILAEQKQGVKRPGRTPKHLFAGKVKCHCGATMYKPSNTPKYVCKACRNKIPIEDLEKIYLHELNPFLKQSDQLTAIIGQWAELDPQIKHRIIDSTIDGVALQQGNAVEFIFSYSPFSKDVAHSQQWENPTDPEQIRQSARSGNWDKASVQTLAEQAGLELPHDESHDQPHSGESVPRQQLSTKEAASLLGYHPKTLLKNASKWGLTKIYMSQTNVCFYQDEIVKLAKSRSYNGRSADS
jgi:hypothetical protein